MILDTGLSFLVACEIWDPDKKIEMGPISYAEAEEFKNSKFPTIEKRQQMQSGEL